MTYTNQEKKQIMNEIVDLIVEMAFADDVPEEDISSAVQCSAEFIKEFKKGLDVKQSDTYVVFQELKRKYM